MKTIDINIVKQAALEAGRKIMEVYARADFSGIVDYKSDNSPLTLADKLSHEVIGDHLSGNFPGIPVLSEEGEETPYEDRILWEYFWLVDPLDGTKEFIKRNGEFTVNIALIHKNRPLLGVIYVPATDTLYYGSKEEGAFKFMNGKTVPLRANQRKDALIAIGSRSHAAPEEEAFLSRFPVIEKISAGSSLKFCRIAEGKADIYYRHGPTMEWDTAAGQAIVEASGGAVLDVDRNIFSYNKKSLRNNSFICLSHLPLLK